MLVNEKPDIVFIVTNYDEEGEPKNTRLEFGGLSEKRNFSDRLISLLYDFLPISPTLSMART